MDSIAGGFLVYSNVMYCVEYLKYFIRLPENLKLFCCRLCPKKSGQFMEHVELILKHIDQHHPQYKEVPSQAIRQIPYIGVLVQVGWYSLSPNSTLETCIKQSLLRECKAKALYFQRFEVVDIFNRTDFETFYMQTISMSGLFPCSVILLTYVQSRCFHHKSYHTCCLGLFCGKVDKWIYSAKH